MRQTVMRVALAATLSLGLLQAAPLSQADARRSALIKKAANGAAAVPALATALNDNNRIVRRTATRLLSRIGAPAQEALHAAFANADEVVRQTALKALLALETTDRVVVLDQALEDKSLLVRMQAVNALAGERPRNKAITLLLQKAAKDKDDTIRKVASKALWPFHRNVIPLRERSDWDHEVTVVQTLPLPREGWKFALDSKRDGHLRDVFKVDFDDQGWADMAIEQVWQKAGYDYVGVSWYRRNIDLPARPEGKINAVEIRCEGVDECAWVWINGTYVGGHDIGPSGWNKPFSLDITKEIKWGDRNQITIRAMNTAHGGGIWRPVHIEVLR